MPLKVISKMYRELPIDRQIIYIADGRDFNTGWAKTGEDLRGYEEYALLMSKDLPDIKELFLGDVQAKLDALEATCAAKFGDLFSKYESVFDTVVNLGNSNCAKVLDLETKHVALSASVTLFKKEHSQLHSDLASKVQDGIAKHSALSATVAGLERKHSQSLSDLANKVEDGIGKLNVKIAELQEDLDALDKKPAFFTNYATVPAPETLPELEEAMETFVRAYSKPFEPPEPFLEKYLDDLKQEINMPIPSNCDLTPLEHGGCRLWTCDLELMGHKGKMKLYSALSQIARDDDAVLLRSGGLKCLKGLNASAVHRHGPTRLRPPQSLNWDFRTHRGTGIQADKIEFWRKLLVKPAHRRKYRAPIPLASSIASTVAEGFLKGVPAHLVQVHFILEWPQDEDCLHGVFIDSVSACQGEDEMLLAAYSVLEPLSLDDSSIPIKIHLKVYPDNKKQPEYLPLTDWH